MIGSPFPLRIGLTIEKPRYLPQISLIFPLSNPLINSLSLKSLEKKCKRLTFLFIRSKERA